jgi:hypothetical protein
MQLCSHSGLSRLSVPGNYVSIRVNRACSCWSCCNAGHGARGWTRASTPLYWTATCVLCHGFSRMRWRGVPPRTVPIAIAPGPGPLQDFIAPYPRFPALDDIVVPRDAPGLYMVFSGDERADRSLWPAH